MSKERSAYRSAHSIFTPEVDGVHLSDDDAPTEYILHSISGHPRLSKSFPVGKHKGSTMGVKVPQVTRFVSYLKSDGSTDFTKYDDTIPMHWHDIPHSGKTPVQVENIIAQNPADYDLNPRIKNVRKEASAAVKNQPIDFTPKIAPIKAA